MKYTGTIVIAYEHNNTHLAFTKRKEDMNNKYTIVVSFSGFIEDFTRFMIEKMVHDGIHYVMYADFYDAGVECCNESDSDSNVSHWHYKNDYVGSEGGRYFIEADIIGK